MAESSFERILNNEDVVNKLSTPDTSEKTATDTGILTVTDAMAANACDLVVGIEPVQDLHGYDHPWPAGGGKNLVNPENWSNASSNQVTYTVDKEKGTITITGKATANSYAEYDLSNLLPNTAYILTGAPSGSSESSTYNLQVQGLGTTAKDTGSGASFTTGSDVSGLKLRVTVYQGASGGGKVFYPMVRLSSVSDATFAPYSNICPITGWTGANVTRTGVNVWDGTDELGYIDMSNGEERSTESIYRSLFVPIFPSKSYCYVNENISSGIRLAFYDKDKTFISSIANNDQNPQVFTSPSNARYCRFYSSFLAKVSINYPSSDHDYHAYIGVTIPISWQSEAGTVYGGTLDVTTGLLTVTMAEVDLGTLKWDPIPTTTSGIYRMRAAFPMPCKGVANDKVMNGVCSIYQVISASNTFSKIQGLSSSSLGDMVHVYDENYNTSDSAAAFKADMSGVQLVYELATPQTYQLTPTQVALLLGQNNIWADVSGDSGTITLDYLALTGELTKKPLSAEMGNVLNATKVNVADVVNDLISTATDKPLSAAQGKVLNEAISQSTAAIDKGIGIGTNMIQTTLSSLISCTGNVSDCPFVVYSGDYAYIMGRLTIDNFARTGGNAGAILTLPNGKKNANDFTVDANGYSASSAGFRLGEQIVVQGTANESVFSVVATETYSNMSGTEMFYILAPFVIKIK